MKKINYIGKIFSYRMIIVPAWCPSPIKAILFSFFLVILTEFTVKGQDVFVSEKGDPPMAYDQVPVLVIVEGIESFYVDVIYTNSDWLYLNIADLFRTLKILCVDGQEGNSLAGFIENESQPYSVDYNLGIVKVGDKTINSSNRLIKENGSIFMESSLFAEAFGITLSFNYRALSIILKSNFELPVIKKQRIERMRSNVLKIKGEIVADTLLKRNYHLLKFGTMDWSLGSYQTWNEKTNNQFSLGIGTELLYGEADLSVNYYDQYKFDNRSLQYLWRWADNDKQFIKQAQVGKISSQTISFINSPIVGAVIRNSPTTVRKASGYYTINESTEPNWTVELYINDVMVDYTKADASGLFTFKVPIVYGYTTLKLKFYGPMGEERTEERAINLPYTIMSAKEFEYSISAGILQDSSQSRFGKGELNYGINRFLTVGGGLEYLSSISNGPFIPYAKATIQPYNKLTINAEYAHGVRTRGLLNYYLNKDILLEIDYTKYVEGQLATRFNSLEERKIKLSFPFRYKKIIGFSKFDYTQYVYKTFNYNQAVIMVSSYYLQFSVNSTTQLNWIEKMPAYFNTDLSLSYRLSNGYTLRPAARFDISDGKFQDLKATVEKRIPNGYFSITYDRNVLFNDNYIYLSFKYDLHYARTNVSASHTKGIFATSESAQGSLAFDTDSRYVHVSNNSSVSKGGITIYPFLDLNNNGIFDNGEPMVRLTTVRVTGGKAIFDENSSVIRIPDLNAFISYNIEFDNNDLDNIAWRFKKKNYSILVDPNQFKHVDIPIIAVGEVSGIAYMNDGKSMKGIGRILIKIYNKYSAKVVAETISESDGYIYYMGLPPGEYVARVDSVQLSNLNFTADPPLKFFAIAPLVDGDIVRGIDFVLNKNGNGVVTKSNVPPTNSTKKDPEKIDLTKLRNKGLLNSSLRDNEITAAKSLKVEQKIVKKSEIDLIWGHLCTQPGNYYIQCGSFKIKDNAMNMALKIYKNPEVEVGIELYDDLYKVQVGCVTESTQAEELKTMLSDKKICESTKIFQR
jgi:hypothetical protein